MGDGGQLTNAVFVNSVIKISYKRIPQEPRQVEEEEARHGKEEWLFLTPPVCFDDFHCISYLCNLGLRAGFKNGQF